MAKINQSTPAKASQVAAACTALAMFIGGYGLTAQNPVIGCIGLGLGCIGVLIPFIFGEDKK